ncbi:DUF4810 domain-containing protein [Brumicola blandensis]|jgi:hypothetical protein|uniref:DUF4810 domain-containing protein n=1 Tax=Brumicola blandensis TaxID=3075611 RepID=A0AAW8R3F5_9ALTE|nr:DUF4810 domain-containing protein [Alteromonas sp. W409]MDT0583712.1 DUF4810 domain-containing protein [Alteromonas sp. W409]
MKQIQRLLLLLTTAATLSACVTAPKPLYYHGEQAEAVYSYLKADDLSISEQILLMEQTMQNASSTGLPLAPGFHAHLGMLYFESGNTSGGIEQFEVEKSLFPESSKYLDYLLAQLQGSDAK